MIRRDPIDVGNASCSAALPEPHGCIEADRVTSSQLHVFQGVPTMTTMHWLAGFAVAATAATSLLAAPPPAGETPPPASPDRGILSGPDVDSKARDGRQPFGRGERPGGQPGAEREGGEPLGRMMAMLVASLREVAPSDEQQVAIRAYFAEMREKAAKFGEEDGKRLRDLTRIRRELVRDGQPTAEVDAELATLREKVVEPRKVVAEIEKLLDPERAAKLRESLAKARREAAERMRRERGERGRPGRATQDGMMDEGPMGDPMMDDARRPRDRDGRQGRGRGSKQPPLDLGETPPPPPPAG
jgi:hypothetical protein